MSRPMWFVRLVEKAMPHSVAVAKAAQNRVVAKAVERLLFKGDDMMVLPKDRVIAVNRDLEPPQSMVLPSQVVEHFVKRASVRWLMHRCICRQSCHCRDYPIDLGCIFMGDAALQINPALGRVVSESEALEHLERCREAGLVHLVGKNKLDSVWLGVSPGHRLFTICNCCPCCCLSRAVVNLPPKLSDTLSRMPGVRVTVSDACQACRVCEDVCFVDAINLDGDRAEIAETCRGCGRCVSVCPENAIELEILDDTFVRQAIERLETKIDVT